MNTKKNEIDYVSNLTPKEKKWLYTKPFGNYNYKESFMRIRDISYIFELLSLKEDKKMSLLDLGCGTGWTSIMIAKLGIDVTAVDISVNMIVIANENIKKEDLKVKTVVSDIENISYKNQFDRVLLYDGLHHCPNEKKVLKNAYRALKPGGMLLLVEPNKGHQHNPGAQKIAERFGVLEKGYTPGYLKKEMKKIGFMNIVRYHCNYGINKPMAGGIKSFMTQIARLIITRLVLSHYLSQVWMTAKK